MRKRMICLILFSFIMGGTFLTGCKKPNPDGRMDVYGKITVNGTPIKDGRISFITEEVTEHESGGSLGVIKDGSYHLTGKSGVKPGTYKVVIRGGCDYDSDTGEPATADTPMSRLVTVNLVPMAYGSISTTPESFTVEDGKKNVYNLNIEGEVEMQTKNGFFEIKNNNNSKSDMD